MYKIIGVLYFMKKFVLILCFMALFIPAVAFDLQFRINPGIFFPQNTILVEHDGKMVEEKSYNPGFLATVQVDTILFNYMTAGLEGGLNFLTPDGLTDSSLNFLFGGLGIGATYHPLSRLYLGAGAAFGLYQTALQEQGNVQRIVDFYWRASAETGFRFSPEFTASITGGYLSFLASKGDAGADKSFAGGPFVSLSAKINLTVGKQNFGSFVDIYIEQEEPVYPLYLTKYRSEPIGMLTLVNNEAAEIRNVKVYFNAGKYSASSYECGSASIIRRGGTVDIPLYADFSNELLRYTENGKITGDAIIEYTFLSKPMRIVKNVVIDVNNRNAFTWTNPESLAAFVSPDTNQVLEFAKYVAGIARNDFTQGMSENFQLAAALLESLKLSGITYSNDKVTPYSEYVGTDSLDSIQFPVQTMECISGDYDDLGLLLASCLESINVETALVPLPDDFIVMALLEIRDANITSNFASKQNVYSDGEKVYLPLSMANFEQGFTKSRKAGAEKIAELLKNEDGAAKIIRVHDSWAKYPSVAYSGSDMVFDKPSEKAVQKAFGKVKSEYVASDLESVINNIRKTGNSNKLGTVYVRAGKLQLAKAEFNKGIARGNVSAMNNLANVYMIEQVYNEAAKYYKMALNKDPKNQNAQRGYKTALDKIDN